MPRHPFGKLLGAEAVTSALECRARQEGLVAESDFRMSEFMTSAPQRNSDQGPVDLACLYDELIVRPRHVELTKLNGLLGAALFVERPDFTRLTPWHDEDAVVGFEGGAKETYRISDLDLLQSWAFEEAGVWARQSLSFRNEAYRREYEQFQVRPEWRDPFAPAYEKSHQEAFAALRGAADDIIYVLICNFYSSRELIDASHIEESDLPIGPKSILLKNLRCPRFECYFNFFQDAFCDYYEAAFDGQFLGAELAYGAVPPGRGRVSNIEDTLRVLHVNLADVVDYFPLPRTLREAVDLRGDKKVVAFRAALSRWIKALNRGEDPSSKIRRELDLANRDLKLLKSWRNLREHPLYFGIRTAASYVPQLGVGTMLFDTITYFGEKWTERRHAWVVTPELRQWGAPSKIAA